MAQVLDLQLQFDSQLLEKTWYKFFFKTASLLL